MPAFTSADLPAANQLARVYLGSAYTLRSRDLGFGSAKLAALRRGLAVMDAAVAAAPDNPRIRLVRALTTDSLPVFFGRKKSTRDDFARLAITAQENPAQFSNGDLQLIYFNAGNAAAAAGQKDRARELWHRAADYKVDASVAAKVKAALEQQNL